MNTNFITVEEIPIAYLEKIAPPGSKTIYFIHGNSVSNRTWRKQFSDPLFSDYRLVAIDLPAHGESGAAPETTYTLPGLAELMAKTIEALANGKPYIIAGISLSTNIVAEMLAFGVLPEGLVLAGPSVTGKLAPITAIIKPGTSVNVVFTDESNPDEVLKYAKETSLSADVQDLQIFLEDFQQVKTPFRSALAKSIGDGMYSDEVELLQATGIPLLVVFGADELVVEPGYLDGIALPLWSNRIYKLNGASHLVHIDQPEAFNLLMKDFLYDTLPQ